MTTDVPCAGSPWKEPLVLAIAGSQLHGTATMASDLDLRGVAVHPLRSRIALAAPAEQYEGPLPDALLRRVLASLGAHPNASRLGEASATKLECAIFDIAKFLRLCASANPSALELLFTPEQHWLVHRPRWRQLYDVRHHFLTVDVAETFAGYALGQLRRIERHRGWLLDPPKGPPDPTDFGLPKTKAALPKGQASLLQATIDEKVGRYRFDDLPMSEELRTELRLRLEAMHLELWPSGDESPERSLERRAAQSIGLTEETQRLLRAERRFRQAQKQWKQFAQWQKLRNPARAALEASHGYDTKHAMHLVRLLRMGIEALENGDLNVCRDDAAELCAIRDGAWRYDALLERCEALQGQMRAAKANTTLPTHVDPRWLDGLAETLMLATEAQSARTP